MLKPLQELKERICAALGTIDCTGLQNVWNEHPFLLHLYGSSVKAYCTVTYIILKENDVVHLLIASNAFLIQDVNF